MPIRSSKISRPPKILRPEKYRRLARLTNVEFEYIEELARKTGVDIERCPTCGNPKIELAPGIMTWEPSTYTSGGQEHECDCEWQVELRRFYMLAGIPEDYWTLDERDYWGDKSALGQVHEYLDNWSGRSRYGLGLEIYSEKTGTGKTMLASLIAKALVKRGVRVTFTLFLPLMGLYKQPYEVRHDFEERLRYNRVLVLDEIGEGISDAQHEYFAVEFENLIRERVSANRVTITTTNRIPAVLDAIYPRVYSILASKQQRIEVQYHDTRMAGRVLQEKDTLAKHNSALPIK